MAVRVQVPLAVLRGKDSKYTSLLECVLGLFLLQVAQGTYVGSPARGTKKNIARALAYVQYFLYLCTQID